MLHFRLPLYTRNGQVGGHILVLWFLALVMAGCYCQLVCFEFVVLHFRLPITRNGQIVEHARTEKKQKRPCPAVQGTWGLFLQVCQRSDSQRNLLSCTCRGFPAALLSRSSPAPSIVDESLKTPVPVYTHTDYLYVDTTKTKMYHSSSYSTK